MADYYYICGACNKNLNEKAPSIGCVCCKNWIHLQKGCASLSWKEAKKLNGKYICPKCVAESGVDGEADGKRVKADEDYTRNVVEDDQGVAESGGDGEAAGKEIADEDYARNVVEDDQGVAESGGDGEAAGKEIADEDYTRNVVEDDQGVAESGGDGEAAGKEIADEDYARNVVEDDQGVAESGGDGEAAGKEIADEDYARNVVEDDQEGDFDLYDHGDLVMKGRWAKNTAIVHGKPIPEGHCKFLIKEIVNEWAEFDEDYHCAGAYLTWPSTMTLPSKKEVEKEKKKKRKEKESGRKDDKNKNADGICMMQPSVTTPQPEPMDHSDSDVDIDSDGASVPYEMIFSKGHILGKVVVENTSVNELMHGRTLEKHERKVMVLEVYDKHKQEAEEEEFVDGAFLRVDRLMLKRISFAHKGSKKKRRGHQLGLSPTKWTRSQKMMRNSGQAYVSSSGKKILEKKCTHMTCKCKYKQCKDLTEEVRQSAHNAFWAMGDYNEQNAYLLTLVTGTDKQTAKVQKLGVRSKPKSKMRKYTEFLFAKRCLSRHSQLVTEDWEDCSCIMIAIQTSYPKTNVDRWKTKVLIFV